MFFLATTMNTDAQQNAIFLPENAPELDESESNGSSSEVLDDLWIDEQSVKSLYYFTFKLRQILW